MPSSARSGIEKYCATCGATFSVIRTRAEKARYCSYACRRTGRDVTCEVCGTSFYARASRKPTTRFCSTACQKAWQGRNRTVHVCKTCGSEYRRSPCWSTYTTQLYCSLDCRNADPDFKTRLLAMNTLQQAGRTTRAEAAGYALLDAMGVKYEAQVPFNGKFTPDATVASARLLVQFDGDYWHDRLGCSVEPRIKRRVALDRSQDAYAVACGWHVVRLWESDLRNDLDGCAVLIRSALAEGQVSEAG